MKMFPHIDWVKLRLLIRFLSRPCIHHLLDISMLSPLLRLSALSYFSCWVILTCSAPCWACCQEVFACCSISRQTEGFCCQESSSPAASTNVVFGWEKFVGYNNFSWVPMFPFEYRQSTRVYYIYWSNKGSERGSCYAGRDICVASKQHMDCSWSSCEQETNLL